MVTRRLTIPHSKPTLGEREARGGVRRPELERGGVPTRESLETTLHIVAKTGGALVAAVRVLLHEL